MDDTWIQLSETGRVVGIKFQPPKADELDVWRSFDLPEEMIGDYYLYRVRDDALVYDPHVPSEAEQEAERKTEERNRLIEEAISNLPATIEDTDAALCEIYEAQEQANAETDAALCELYEMLIALGGE